MLGSPIRTPPDHSSVANSPGLIAGSYVLHRLLMPRHPPCALHSLSHKHSTKTTKIQTNTNPLFTAHHPMDSPDQHQGWRSKQRDNNSPTTHPHGTTEAYVLSRRCSRPLSSSQETQPTQANHHHQQGPPAIRSRRARETCLTADASGLNSVSRPTPTTHRPARFHTHTTAS